MPTIAASGTDARLALAWPAALGDLGNVFRMPPARDHAPEAMADAKLGLDMEMHGVVRDWALVREGRTDLAAVRTSDVDAVRPLAFGDRDPHLYP